MKKIITIIGLCIVFILVGCSAYNPDEYPYIKLISGNEEIIHINDSFRIKFFVVNPTIKRETLIISYHFEKDCLESLESNSIFDEVFNKKISFVKTPPKYQMGVIEELVGFKFCRRTPFTIYMRDKEGQLIDSERIEIWTIHK